jgi:hypothetical protein
MRSLGIGTGLFAAAVLWFGVAAGADKGWNKPLRVTMKYARADYDKQGRLVWSYRVSEASWQMLARLKIPAFVDAYTVRMEQGKELRVFRYRSRLQREGRAWLTAQALAGWQSADFEITGAMAEYWLNGMVIGGASKRHSRWKLRQAGATAPPAGATYPQIVEACNQHFHFARDRKRCVAIGKQLRPDQVLETIRVCATSEHFTRKRLQCLDRAPRR